MPIRAPRICSCGKTVPYGAMCGCQIRRKALLDRERPNARERGYDSKWEKARRAFLADHPTCSCGAQATVVHHGVPHRGDMKLFWDRKLWRPRCASCHNSADQSAEKRAAS